AAPRESRSSSDPRAPPPGAPSRAPRLCSRPPAAREGARAGTVDDYEPNQKDARADDRGDRKDAAQRTGALVVAGRPAHEDPCLVQTPQERECPEQERKQPDERHEDAEADAAGEIVDLRADP